METFVVADCPLLVPVMVNATGKVVELERPDTVTVVLWPGVIWVGLNVHVTVLEQLKVMLPLKAESTAAALTVRLTESVPIKGMVEGPLDDREKSGRAVPVRLATGAVPVRLLVKLTAPVCVPVTLLPELEVDELVGLNVTKIWQLLPGERVEGQLFVWVNAPEIVILTVVKSALPVLVSVTVCGALVLPTSWSLKVREVGEKVAAGAGVVPVPDKATGCGLPVALSAMLRFALSAAVVEGVKVTLIVHCDPPAATDDPQSFVCLKSEALLPPTEMPEIESPALPTFVRVTACEALVEFCPWFPKSTFWGLRATLATFA